MGGLVCCPVRCFGCAFVYACPAGGRCRARCRDHSADGRACADASRTRPRVCGARCVLRPPRAAARIPQMWPAHATHCTHRDATNFESESYDERKKRLELLGRLVGLQVCVCGCCRPVHTRHAMVAQWSYHDVDDPLSCGETTVSVDRVISIDRSSACDRVISIGRSCDHDHSIDRSNGREIATACRAARRVRGSSPVTVRVDSPRCTRRRRRRRSRRASRRSSRARAATRISRRRRAPSAPCRSNRPSRRSARSGSRASRTRSIRSPRYVSRDVTCGASEILPLNSS